MYQWNLIIWCNKKLKPSKYFNINVHVDGLAKTHDAIAGNGVFERATNAIREAKQAGFRVCTNTTIYKNTTEDEIKELFSFLEGLGVDGMLVSRVLVLNITKMRYFFAKRNTRQVWIYLWGFKEI